MGVLARVPPAVLPLGAVWTVIVLGSVLGAAVLQVLGPLPRAAAPPTALAGSTSAVLRSAWDGRTPMPIAALLEPARQFPGAMLPQIGPDGRMPRVAYARPATGMPGRPQIAIVLSGLALSEIDSLYAIRSLPGVVTLAISPYAANAAPVLAAARAQGHELLASVPMEPDGGDTAGRRALLTGASPDENSTNLAWALSRTQGYAGVTGAGDNGLVGGRFAAQSSSFGLMLDEVARRGLYYLDPRVTPHALPVALPSATVAVILDEPPTAELDIRLATAERIARDKGSAIALAGPPRRATVERLAAWVQTLEARGFVLVPVSALVATPSKDGP